MAFLAQTIELTVHSQVMESIWGHFAGGPGLNPVDVKDLDEAIGRHFAQNQ